MVRIVDRLADATGIGEAIAGGIMLGAATSLGGTVTSISTAYSGATDLAISNAIGGIAVQTAFLGIADLTYRRANLEHAAASVENLLQAALLVSMLSIPLVASSVPAVTVFGVDLFSFVILSFYIFVNWMVLQAKRAPMWYPQRSRETQNEAEEGEEDRANVPRLVAAFIPLALLSGGAGYVLGDTGIILSERTGISQTAVGGIMTSVMTSIPELVTSIAAVRRGALNLAVGGIIGGNVFDVLFLVLGDVAYREGSLYHAFTDTHRFAVARHGTFAVTGADALPGGDVILAERRYDGGLEVGMRIRRIGADAFTRKARTLDGPILLETDLASEIDNIEAIAAQVQGGDIVLTLLSDDNFNLFQRTLLLRFRIADPVPRPKPARPAG